MSTWLTICELLAELPGTEVDPPAGERVARVAGKRLAYIAETERSRPAHFGDDEVLVVRTQFPTRAALIAEDLDNFAVTPHYETYPGVLVRLRAIPPDQMRELLTDAWRIVAPKRFVRLLDTI